MLALLAGNSRVLGILWQLEWFVGGGKGGFEHDFKLLQECRLADRFERGVEGWWGLKR